MRIKKPVVEFKNMSRKWPIQITISWVLIIKTFGLLSTMIGAIIVGAVSLILALFWGWAFMDVMKYDETPVDIFKPKEHEENKSVRRNRRQPVADDEDDEFVQ